MDGDFIRFLPTQENVVLPCAVQAATRKDALYWDELVRPFIKAAPGFRPDASWHWPNLIRRASFAERRLGRRIAYLQLAAVSGGRRIPVGQLLLSVGYDFLPDVKKKSIYLWYVSAAPAAFLSLHNLGTPKLLRALVDTAIQFSVQAGFEGRVCLHAMKCADPAYHAQLFNMYCSVGLIPISITQPIPKWTKRNDGRFFYCDEHSRLAVSSNLNRLR